MIASLIEFKRYLSVDINDESHDEFYTDLLTRAQAEIENYIGYPIEQSTVTDEVHDCSRIIVPNQIPISDLTVKYEDTELTENEDYFVYDSHIVFETYNNPEDRKKITLSYTGGYPSSLVPEALIDAVIQYAAYKLNLNRPLEPNTEIDTRLPKEIKTIIDPFRKVILI